MDFLRFETLMCAIYDTKEIVQFKHQSELEFYDMIKIRLIMINNVNIFTVYF